MGTDRCPSRGAPWWRVFVAAVRLSIGVALTSPTAAQADDVGPLRGVHAKPASPTTSKRVPSPKRAQDREAPRDDVAATPTTPAPAGAPTPESHPLVETPAAPAAPSPAAPSPAAPSERRHARRERWRADRRSGPRFERRFGVDYLRVSAPGGLGVGLRYVPVPAFALDASFSSLLLTSELAFSATLYPLNAFRASPWAPLLRVGYRNERFLPYADKLLGGLAPSFHSATSAAQLSVDGLSFHAIAVELGVSFVNRKGTIVEISVGRVFQVGSSYGSDPREGVVFTGARLPAASVTVGKLFGRRRPR